MANRNYSNTAPPVPLAAGVSAADTTLTVASTAGYPAAPFILAVDRARPSMEIMLCTATTGTTFTVTRGFDGTAAQAHATGAIVEHTLAAADFREWSTGAISDDRLPARLASVVGNVGVPTDLNDAILTGFYYGSANVPNRPADAYAYVEVINLDGSNIRQEWNSITTDERYVRYRISSVWQAWRRMHVTRAEQDSRYILSGSGTIPDARLPARLSTTSRGVTDWNEATSSGWWTSSGSDQGALNTPITGGEYWIGEVVVHDNNAGVNMWLTQTVWKLNTGAANSWCYRRTYQQGSGWSAWFKLSLSQEEQDSRYLRRDTAYTSNPFDKNELYISEIHDVFYRANGRKDWTVSANVYDRATETFVRSLTSSQTAALFDHDPETRVDIEANHYLMVDFNFGSMWPGYPYGNIYVDSYASGDLEGAYANVYAAIAVTHPVGWHYMGGTRDSQGSNLRWTIPQSAYAIDKMSVVLVAKPQQAAAISGIEFGLTRATVQKKPSDLKFVSRRPEHLGERLGNDCNNATTGGTYNFAPETLNTPDEITNQWGILDVQMYSDNWVRQRAQGLGTTGTDSRWERWFDPNQGVWSAWYRMSPAVAEQDARYVTRDAPLVGDANTATSPGLYFTTQTTTNLPAEDTGGNVGWWGSLEVLKAGAGGALLFQRYTRMPSGNPIVPVVWQRFWSGTVWTAWEAYEGRTTNAARYIGRAGDQTYPGTLIHSGTDLGGVQLPTVGASGSYATASNAGIRPLGLLPDWLMHFPCTGFATPTSVEESDDGTTWTNHPSGVAAFAVVTAFTSAYSPNATKKFLRITVPKTGYPSVSVAKFASSGVLVRMQTEVLKDDGAALNWGWTGPAAGFDGGLFIQKGNGYASGYTKLRFTFEAVGWAAGNTFSINQIAAYSTSNTGGQSQQNYFPFRWDSNGNLDTIAQLKELGQRVYSPGNTPGPALRSMNNMTGGGNITLDASYNLKWTQRFIIIANGRGAHFSTNGLFDISMPPDGTVITGVGGATDQTVAGGAINLPQWTALYYILPIGSTNTTVAANFRLVSYTSDVVIPDHWVMIALRNPESTETRLGRGGSIMPGQSITAANPYPQYLRSDSGAVVRNVWTGTAYPARPAATYVEWVGPAAPTSGMQAGDTYVKVAI